MYVCMSQAAERVCMYVSGILSMYVCMSQTYIDSNLTPCWACMYVRRWACMYLSKPRVLSTLLPVGHNGPHHVPWPLGDPQKVIHIDTILILVYIHTHTVVSLIKRPFERIHIIQKPFKYDGCWSNIPSQLFLKNYKNLVSWACMLGPKPCVVSWKMKPKRSNINSHFCIKNDTLGSSWQCMYVRNPCALTSKWNIHTLSAPL